MSILQACDQAAPFSDVEWEVLPAFLCWRWVRDPVIFYDQFWLDIRDTALALFDGAEEEMVQAERWETSRGLRQKKVRRNPGWPAPSPDTSRLLRRGRGAGAAVGRDPSR